MNKEKQYALLHMSIFMDKWQLFIAANKQHANMGMISMIMAGEVVMDMFRSMY